MSGLTRSEADTFAANEEAASLTVYLGEKILDRARAVSQAAARRVAVVLGHVPGTQACGQPDRDGSEPPFDRGGERRA
jgi:hypothetical protein